MTTTKRDFPTMTRFAATHINADGVRQLTRANQGRNHFDTLAEAEAWIDAVKANNAEEMFDRIYKQGAFGTLKALPVECYLNGDAVGIYFPQDAATL